MKRKILLALVLLLTCNAAFSYNYKADMLNGIKDGQKICYNPAKKSWSAETTHCPVLFTKYITTGTGGFSELEYNNIRFGINSTYEFLDGQKLIGYNAHTLKFYNITYDGKKIVSDILPEGEIKKYFPDVQIVKISHFNNGSITLEKPWFKRKTFLLLNDTGMDFYKYQFEHKPGNCYELIKGIFEVKRPQTIIYSHFASNDPLFPKLKIRVRNQ